MAGKKISEINNPVTTLTGNELQEIVQVGVTKTVTPTNQKEFNQAQLKHDSFTDVATAATDVTKGHVNNDYPLQIPELTTTERDAVTPVEGMLIFNTTDSEFQMYIGTTWEADYNSGNANLSTVDWAAKILNAVSAVIGTWVYIYGAVKTAVIRNTVKDGSTLISGGDQTSDGANIRLGGSTGTNDYTLRIGATEVSKVTPAGVHQIRITPPTGAITDPVLVRDSSGNVKQITQVKQTSVASSATPTPTGDARENEYYLTALAAGATFAAPSGTPANGNKLLIRIEDNGTERILSWNEIYRNAIGIPLPTSTVAGNYPIYCYFIYNSKDLKWDLQRVIQSYV